MLYWPVKHEFLAEEVNAIWQHTRFKKKMKKDVPENVVTVFIVGFLRLFLDVENNAESCDEIDKIAIFVDEQIVATLMTTIAKHPLQL